MVTTQKAVTERTGEVEMGQFELHERLQQDTLEVTRLSLCRVLLMNNRHFPWLILVPQVPGIREIHELSEEQQVQLIRESSLVGRKLMELYQGDKLNVAALGNMVPQLHVHHIVRHKTDPCWPAPVWGSPYNEPYTEVERLSRLEELRLALA